MGGKTDHHDHNCRTSLNALRREALQHAVERLRDGRSGVSEVAATVEVIARELAVRVAARTRTREEAIKVGREVDGMAVSGVGMTGKRVPHQDRTREVIGVWSSLVPREKIVPTIAYYQS